MKLPYALRGEPRRHAEVGKATLPALEHPVTPIRGGATGLVPGEPRTGVRTTDVFDLFPERGAELHVAARVVTLECDLRTSSARRPRVDRAPEDRVETFSANRVIDDRATFRVDLQADVLRVSGDDLARGSRRNGHEPDESRSQEQKQAEA